MKAKASKLSGQSEGGRSGNQGDNQGNQVTATRQPRYGSNQGYGNQNRGETTAAKRPFFWFIQS